MGGISPGITVQFSVLTMDGTAKGVGISPYLYVYIYSIYNIYNNYIYIHNYIYIYIYIIIHIRDKFRQVTKNKSIL